MDIPSLNNPCLGHKIKSSILHFWEFGEKTGYGYWGLEASWIKHRATMMRLFGRLDWTVSGEERQSFCFSGIAYIGGLQGHSHSHRQVGIQ